MADVPSWARPLEPAAGAVPAWARPLEATAPKFSPHVDPLEGATDLQKAAAAYGGGLLNIGKSAFELMSHAPGLGRLAPDKQKWAEQKQSLADLEANSGRGLDVPYGPGLSLRLTPGNVGNFAGEMTATLPAAMVGGGAARAGLSLAGLGTTEAVQSLPFLLRAATRAAPLATEGASQGLVLGGPDHRLEGTVMGGLFGAGAGVGGETFSTLSGGLVKPTPEALDLIYKAARNEVAPPTLGQMNPGGFLSKIEEAGQHSALGGPSIQAKRLAAREGWQRAALGEVLPPGVKKAPAGDVPDALNQIYEGFGKAYEPIKQAPISRPAGISDAFSAIVNDDGVIATDASRGAVGKFLKNQSSILDRAYGQSPQGLGDALRAVRSQLPTSGNLSPEVLAAAEQPAATAEPLLKVRSAIRSQIRQLSKGQNTDWAQVHMLNNAEDAVTGALESGLPPDASAALRAVDSKYGAYKTLENAVYRAGDQPGSFTPAQLSAAARASAERGDYARGGGGELRNLAQLGREVLENKSPMTGAIKQTLPFGLNHLAGPASAFLNGPGRNFALGITAPQRAANSLLDMLSQIAPERLGAGNFVPSPNALLVPGEVKQR